MKSYFSYHILAVSVTLVVSMLVVGRSLAAPKLKRHTPRTTATVTAVQWQLFSPPGSGLSVLMPGIAKSIPMPSPTGIPLHMFGCSTPVTGYAVQYFDIPSARLRSTTPRMLLESLVGTTVRPKNTTLLSEREIALQGFPGREVILSKLDSTGDQRQALRLFLVKGRCFLVITSRYPTETDPFRNRAEVFINSFRLLPEDIPGSATAGAVSGN